MIQANELRIGNWINSKLLWSNHKVTGLLPDRLYTDLQLSYSEYEDWQPILLTPEILEKCGFVFINHTFYTKDNIVSFAVFNNNLSTTYVCGDNQINKTEYLHQLQTLYYSLTGNELEVVW